MALFHFVNKNIEVWLLMIKKILKIIITIIISLVIIYYYTLAALTSFGEY